MTKRLFLFATYDADGKIDASVVHYARAASHLGDVVMVMDSDADAKQLANVAPYTIHAAAMRHREYDFGSYKRAYIWAKENLNLADYDFVYLINDSVYGPMYDMAPVITELESRKLDAFGMVCNPNTRHPHIQSWFIGMRKSVFLSKWFDEFIQSVKQLDSKGMVTRLYEHRFSALVTEHGLKWDCKLTIKNRGAYNRVRYMYKNGVPFTKKMAFTRHSGRLGAQIAYVMRHADTHARDAVLENARRVWGAEYTRRLITRNPIKIAYRTIKHGIQKLIKGGI